SLGGQQHQDQGDRVLPGVVESGRGQEPKPGEKGRPEQQRRELPAEQEKADPPPRPAHALAAGAQGGVGRLALEKGDGQGKGPPDVEEQAGGEGGQQEKDADGRRDPERRRPVRQVVIDVVPRQEDPIRQDRQQDKRGERQGQQGQLDGPQLDDAQRLQEGG